MLRCSKHEKHRVKTCREVFWSRHGADGTRVRTLASFCGAQMSCLPELRERGWELEMTPEEVSWSTYHTSPRLNDALRSIVKSIDGRMVERTAKARFELRGRDKEQRPRHGNLYRATRRRDNPRYETVGL